MVCILTNTPGTFILFVGFFSFNAGSQLTLGLNATKSDANGTSVSLAMANTILSAAGGGFAAIAFDHIYRMYKKRRLRESFALLLLLFPCLALFFFFLPRVLLRPEHPAHAEWDLGRRGGHHVVRGLCASLGGLHHRADCRAHIQRVVKGRPALQAGRSRRCRRR